jgi:hypothetical protein
MIQESPRLAKILVVGGIFVLGEVVSQFFTMPE